MANPPNPTEYTRIPNQRSPESESSNREHNTDQRIREERFEAIRSFSRGVSHQFNNLLTPPLGELSILLAETTVRDLPPNTVSSLNEIKDSLVRIARYINRLAQATGTTDPLPTFNNLMVNPLIQEEVREIKEKNGIRKAEVIMHLKSELSLLANAQLIRKKIRALLDNAFEAVGRDGTIKISSTDEEHHVTIEIADNGSGMDPIVRQRCLEPFFSTKGSVGVGLGLTMAQITAQAHGATMEIESAPNQGTRIRLRFPSVAS